MSPFFKYNFFLKQEDKTVICNICQAKVKIKVKVRISQRMRSTARMFYFCLLQLIHESIGFGFILTDLDIIVIFNKREISYW